MLAGDRCAKRDQGHPEEKERVPPEQPDGRVRCRPHQRVVIDQHDGDHEKAQRVDEELWAELDDHLAEVPARESLGRRLQLQHHDGDDDGDDAIAEGLDAGCAGRGLVRTHSRLQSPPSAQRFPSELEERQGAPGECLDRRRELRSRDQLVGNAAPRR